jgi:hypothetical protein
MTVPIAIAAETATKPTEQKDNEDNNEYASFKT